MLLQSRLTELLPSFGLVPFIRGWFLVIMKNIRYAVKKKKNLPRISVGAQEGSSNGGERRKGGTEPEGIG